MTQAFALAQNLATAEILNPAADAAGRTGTYVSCKFAHKIFIVVHVTQGNAATIVLSVLQAQDVSGTNSKAIGNNVRIWANQDTSVAANVLTRQTDGTSFTTSSAVKNKVVVFEIEPAMLDLTNNFKTVTISTGASNAANITQAMAYATPTSAEEALPSIAVN